MSSKSKRCYRVSITRTAFLFIILSALCIPVLSQDSPLPPLDRSSKNGAPSKSEGKKLVKPIGQVPDSSRNFTEQPQSKEANKCKETFEIVIIMASPESDADKAVLLKRKLVGLKYRQVEGPWPNGDPNDRPSTSQVRWFHSDEDVPCAEQLAKEIEEITGKVVDVVQGLAGPKPPKNRFEVYLK